MLVLTLTVCPQSAPDNCGEARLQFSTDDSLMRCLIGAPPSVAQGADQHTGRQVTHWRCAYPEHADQST
jgi:hypothetical protein